MKVVSKTSSQDNPADVAELKGKRSIATMTGLTQFDAAKKVGQINIFDEIGDPFFGLTASAFKEAFDKISGAEEIVININSPGGDVFDGTAIYNILRDYKGKKTVKVMGIAASMASIIAMVGDEIQVADNAFIFIHDAEASLRRASAKQLKDVAKQLESISSRMAQTYADRTNGDPKEIRRMMVAETLMDSEAAVDLGFADALMEGSDTKTAMTHMDAMKPFGHAFNALQEVWTPGSVKPALSGNKDDEVETKEGEASEEKTDETPTEDADEALTNSEADETEDETVTDATGKLAMSREEREARMYLAQQNLKEMGSRI